MRILILLLALLLSACVTPAVAPDVTSHADACTVDADCAVKNVGNCCGAYPQCVNVAYSPDPAAVFAACQREGRSSVCGYSEISACACVEGRCAATADGNRQ